MMNILPILSSLLNLKSISVNDLRHLIKGTQTTLIERVIKVKIITIVAIISQILIFYICTRSAQGYALVGGTPLEPSEAPWAVSIANVINGSIAICSGVILNVGVIATSRHCIEDRKVRNGQVEIEDSIGTFLLKNRNAQEGVMNGEWLTNPQNAVRLRDPVSQFNEPFWDMDINSEDEYLPASVSDDFAFFKYHGPIPDGAPKLARNIGEGELEIESLTSYGGAHSGGRLYKKADLDSDSVAIHVNVTDGDYYVVSNAPSIMQTGDSGGPLIVKFRDREPELLALNTLVEVFESNESMSAWSIVNHERIIGLQRNNQLVRKGCP